MCLVAFERFGRTEEYIISHIIINYYYYYMYRIILHDCSWPIHKHHVMYSDGTYIIIIYTYIQYLEAVGCMICFSATYLKYIQLKQIHAALLSRNLLALAISHSSKCTAYILQRVSMFGKMLYLLVIQTCTFKMRTCSVYRVLVVGLQVTVRVCVLHV